MAKKQNHNTTTSKSNYSIVKVCAFVGLVFAGVAGLLAFIFWLLGKVGVYISWGGRVRNICNLVSQVALFVTVWLAAWDYVKYKSKTWRIIYFIFLVLGILGLLGIGIF